MQEIGWIWIALGCFWLLAAMKRKATARAQTPASRLMQAAVVAAAFLLLYSQSARAGILGARFVPDSPDTLLAGMIVTAAGAAIAMWARLTIGSNWSGTVTVKEGHELICSGPYRIVRHPIYSGLLLAVLGTAIAIGELRGLVALALGFAGFWWKSRTEEAFMIQEFGDQYARYRREVKALIPFVL